MDENIGGDAAIGVVVGLGNPGSRYEATRHNAGFQVVDLLARRFGIPLEERRFPALYGLGRIEGCEVVLVKPTTFMNRSGEGVVPILGDLRIPPSRMLVVSDDLDLPCGRLRLARGGGAAGHRGVASIRDCLGGGDFPRLKLGIGRPGLGEPVEVYVLSPPYLDQEQPFREMISRGVDVVLAALAGGLSYAMNRFNRKDVSKPELSVDSAS